MKEGFSRRLSGIVGAFLLLIVSGAVLLGMPLSEDPVSVVQLSLLGLAGLADIVAATETRLTDRIAWYRWSGVGNVLLGVALPLGFVGTDGSVAFLVTTGLGGMTLAAMGIDMAVFHGRYTRGQRLNHDTT